MNTDFGKDLDLGKSAIHFTETLNLSDYESPPDVSIHSQDHCNMFDFKVDENVTIRFKSEKALRRFARMNANTFGGMQRIALDRLGLAAFKLTDVAQAAKVTR